MRLNLFNSRIEKLFIHFVGNKAKGVAPIFSNQPITLDDELHALFKEYFLKPLRGKDMDMYQFVEESDGSNDLKEILDIDTNESNISRSIAVHLHNQSNYPHIRSGEVYIAHFENVLVENVPVNAIGIFKSELKKDYIQFKETASGIKPQLQQGVSLDKLDKGALLFKIDGEFRIITVDSNRYDSKYWFQNFLNIDLARDQHFNTKKYLKFIDDFSTEVILPAYDKNEQINFINQSREYFASNDRFRESEFLTNLLDTEMHPEFENYKIQKGHKYSIENVIEFDISNTAVTIATGIKPKITLDNNISITIPTAAAGKHVEKAFCEEKQMYYYKVFFNRENRK